MPISQDLELRARWPFRILAGLVGLAIGLTFGGLIYDVVRYPQDLDLSLAEWLEVVVSFLVLGAIALVACRVAAVGSLREPALPPISPHTPSGASNCIRCGSFCAPDTGAFIAPAGAALCTPCIGQIYAPVKAGDVTFLDCVTYADASVLQIGCSYCGQRNRSELFAWPGATICRSCLELAAADRERK